MSIKTLVTGAEGFIGSHLVERLLRDGYDVRAFIWYRPDGSIGNLKYLDPDILSNIEIVKGDVRDYDILRSSIKGIDWVFHLAALIGIPYSFDTPHAYVETNVLGTLNTIQASCDLSVSRVVVVSTSEVYGSAQYVPINEEHPLNAQSPYAASKIGADHLALSFVKAFGAPIRVIRPFNTYGPRQSERAVIPTIIGQLLRHPEKLELGDLAPTRDFTYASDTATGLIAGARVDDIDGEVINLGTGHEISIEELALLIASLMDKKPEIISDHRRIRPGKSEVKRLISNNAKARDLLEWSPLKQGLEGLSSGLSMTIEWFKTQGRDLLERSSYVK